LCDMNLDTRQFQMEAASLIEETIPVMYFTQLMALALGLPEQAAFLNKNMVDPRPILIQRGILPVT
jgi:heterodisulfide reductase subunit B